MYYTFLPRQLGVVAREMEEVLVCQCQYMQLQPPVITHALIYLLNPIHSIVTFVDLQALSLCTFLPHFLLSRGILILHRLTTSVFFNPLCIQFHISSSLSLPAPGSAFYTRSMSSPVRQLQWQSGLDCVYVATESSVSDVCMCDGKSAEAI